MELSIKLLFILTTTIYHRLATLIETKTYPPIGERIDIGGYKLHCYCKGEGSPTVILEFPEKVVAIVLTDGLHESGMLNMSLSLRILKLFFISGFFMSTLGAVLGIVRLLGTVGLFEVIKPELRQFTPETIQRVKRSFYHHHHWITMARELSSLNVSSRQLSQVGSLGTIPIISIKSSTFFKRSLLTFYMPVKLVDRLRDKMHCELVKISNNYREIQASKSSHFVWIDEPEIIVAAIGDILEMLNCK